MSLSSYSVMEACVKVNTLQCDPVSLQQLDVMQVAVTETVGDTCPKDPCFELLPCENGGTCTPRYSLSDDTNTTRVVAHFHCDCVDGWHGINCELRE